MRSKIRSSMLALAVVFAAGCTGSSDTNPGSDSDTATAIPTTWGSETPFDPNGPERPEVIPVEGGGPRIDGHGPGQVELDPLRDDSPMMVRFTAAGDRSSPFTVTTERTGSEPLLHHHGDLDGYILVVDPTVDALNVDTTLMWTAQTVPVSAAPAYIGTEVTGDGPAVFRYTAPGGPTAVSFRPDGVSGQTMPTVRVVTHHVPVMYEALGASSGSFRLPAGDNDLISVTGDGTWVIGPADAPERRGPSPKAGA